MPPDTSYIPGVTVPPAPLDTLIDTTRFATEAMLRHIDSLGEAYLRSKENEGPHYLFPEWQMFLFVLAVVVLSAYFYIIKPSLTGKRRGKYVYKPGSLNRAVVDIQYDHWLNKYNPYYGSLPGDLKKIFLQRTKDFLQSKEFRFHAMVEEEYIPVLISGAAVQMTFGLKNYLMDYFPVIHIVRKEYTLNVDKETYYGHVSRNGIYISWEHFLEGYRNYGDSINVGLHEMAHAVSFDVFLGQQDHHDRTFRQRLEDFREDGIPVFRAMRQGASHLLDEYGATNFDEFWAVCVETFFENPDEFSRLIPGLYISICGVLNQDPLISGKIIDEKAAGLAN
ncbi:MAG: zinc-dependent peptidase [Chitinophagaceae bacterium]